jgi:hypothetical protein
MTSSIRGDGLPFHLPVEIVGQLLVLAVNQGAQADFDMVRDSFDLARPLLGVLCQSGNQRLLIEKSFRERTIWPRFRF